MLRQRLTHDNNRPVTESSKFEGRPEEGGREGELCVCVCVCLCGCVCERERERERERGRKKERKREPSRVKTREHQCQKRPSMEATEA